ncbi:PorP/SprF family type IX secretion system membrane protein [Aureispira anguillae]|uniref:PorP/SprF family type IX secretion system membrane protein n=1 Tax=Aureispira anguillae TaxID=2864201 RepID=A0A915YHE8_9BACT|nr:PorP/SprF family type IX secretion system membrane protein [Aureispira anguillae]BDS13232.1 PorP/SprF family type IX secretion system membrane protein [Aureispira anguillae]
MKLFFRLSLIAIIFNGVSLLPSQELQAQDSRYTQYYQAPLRLNPAMAGVFEGMWRVGANFRTQWGSVMGGPNAYYTYALGAELKTPVFKSDYVGVSFSALTDVAGGGKYNVTDINLGVSYMKKLTGGRRSYRASLTSYLVAGAQIGIGQRSVKWLNLTYSTQYVVRNNTYDPNITSGENSGAMRMTKIYPDLSAGLLWYGVMGERKSVYAGLGLYHLNRPEISLFNRSNTSSDVERLYMRVTAHAGGEFLVGGRSSSISLLPGFVGMFQGPSMELNMGLGIKYQAPRYDDFALKLSVWTRLANRLDTEIDADALMIVLGIDYQTFQFAVSYDINTSTLSNVSNGQGSLEFSVIYTHDGRHARGQGCPSFN